MEAFHVAPDGRRVYMIDGKRVYVGNAVGFNILPQKPRIPADPFDIEALKVANILHLRDLRREFECARQ